MYTNDKQTDWDTYIPSVLWGYRTSVNSSTGETPYYLLFGRSPKSTIDASLLPPTTLTGSVAEHSKRIVSNIELHVKHFMDTV